MIINNECARVLLKEVSNLGINKNLVLDEFILNHPEFNEEEIFRSAYYLNRHDFLMVNNSTRYDENLEVDKYTKIRLVYRYRDFLPYSLVDDEVWEELKKKIDIQKYNFQMLVDLLIRKNTLELNQAFSIPNDIVVRVN